MRTTTALAFALLIAATPAAWGGEAEESAAAGEDFRTVRDQALHYYKQGLTERAVEELERARALPGGDEDFKTHLGLARAYNDLLRLEHVFPFARKAVELARSDRSRAKASGFLGGLEKFYGGVRIEKAPEARTDEGYVYLEDVGGLINPKKKEVFGKLRERYRTEASKLPLTMYLPFGRFTANRVPFETRQGETSTIHIIPDASPDAGLHWAWIAGGAAVLVGASVVAAVLLMPEEEEPTHAVRLSGQGL